LSQQISYRLTPNFQVFSLTLYILGYTIGLEDKAHEYDTYEERY